MHTPFDKKQPVMKKPTDLIKKAYLYVLLKLKKKPFEKNILK